MIDIVKKSVYMGIGLASLTKDRLQKVAADVSKEAQLSEEEGRRLHEELQLKSEEAKIQMEQKIDQRIDQAFVQVGLLKAGVKRAAEHTTDTLQQMVDRRVDAALDRLGIARKEDVESLLQRLELLETKLAATPQV